MADPTPASTPTPNYSFNLPTVGGDDNVWGGLLNDNWSNLDTILWNVSGVANAALTQTAGDARYLRLIGGTVGPNSTIFSGPFQANNYAGFTSTAAFSGQAQFTGGATFGTAQVFFNSPVTFSSTLLAQSPPASDNSQQVPTTSWVNAAVNTAIGVLPVPPAASNATPTMAGTAAPGTSALYSRGDHVHPSDTSRLALSGGTMTGTLALAADPSANLQAATKRYVDAGVLGGTPGGFVNRLRNGTFDVWQRGTSVALPQGTPAYAADGWIAQVGGAATTASQGSSRNMPGAPRSCLALAGVATATTWLITQRIEASVSAPLCGQTCTFSCWVATNGPAFTPTLTISHPTVADNWAGSATDVGPVNLQNVPTGSVWTRLSYTFVMPQANVALGAGITITSPVNLGANTVWVSEADLRATPGVATGLNANPPPPELRPIAAELAFCQRYYQTVAATARFSAAAANQVMEVSLNWPSMRATPTTSFITIGTTGNQTAGNPALTSPKPNGGRWTIQSAAAGDCYALDYVCGLGAEL